MCLAHGAALPPHHPLGAVSECSDKVVYQEMTQRQRVTCIIQPISISD